MPTKRRGPQKVRTTIEFDPEFYEELKAFAARDDRTISAVVRRALIAHIRPKPKVYRKK